MGLASARGGWPVTTISYAQNGEDVLLRRALAERENGFYIDVGAAHPVSDSVTKIFYDEGWSGVNVEPARFFAELLRSERPRDTTLEVALSNTEGTLTFFDGPERDGWSTLAPQVAADLKARGVDVIERTVQTMTLAHLCEEYAPATIDFLKVDVEGHEREVLEGADWQRWRPTVVVVEATVPHTAVPSFDDWETLLLDANYLFAIFDGINRFYVRGEDADLLERFRAPANYLDDFIPHRILAPMQAMENGLVTKDAAINSLQERVDNATTRLEEANAALAELGRKLDIAVGKGDAARQRLASAEAAHADTRLLLAACQSAIESAGNEGRKAPGRGGSEAAIRRARSLLKSVRPGEP
jgi:FkbM family methyltransferase